MGGKKSVKVPTPDVQGIIRQEDLLNRANVLSPFGSSTFTTGPDGRSIQNINASPGMQGLIDRSLGLAGESAQRFDVPSSFSDIGAALANRVGGRLGVEDVKPAPQQLPPSPVGSFSELGASLPGIGPGGGSAMPGVSPFGSSASEVGRAVMGSLPQFGVPQPAKPQGQAVPLVAQNQNLGRPIRNRGAAEGPGSGAGAFFTDVSRARSSSGGAAGDSQQLIARLLGRLK